MNIPEQRFDVGGEQLSRAEILRLPLEKIREILEKQAEAAKEYYNKKVDNDVVLAELGYTIEEPKEEGKEK